MNKKYEEVKCIWADSGIIDYKLCDKSFDCENCELDRVLRKRAVMNSEIAENAGKANNILTKIASEINSLKSDSHNVNLKNYLCLKNLFGDNYFLGISPLVYKLFINSHSSFNSLNNYSVEKSDNIAEINGEWGSISITSPLAMKVLKQIPQENYNSNSSNWIGIVQADSNEIDDASITEAEFYENKKYILEYIKSKEKENISSSNTMYDGGKRVECLSDFLGYKEFQKFLNGLFK